MVLYLLAVSPIVSDVVNGLIDLEKMLPFSTDRSPPMFTFLATANPPAVCIAPLLRFEDCCSDVLMNSPATLTFPPTSRGC